MADLRLVHQGLTNCWRLGATIAGQTSPIRPIVIAVFSSRVFGVLGLGWLVIVIVTMEMMVTARHLLMMVMRGLRMAGM